MTVVNDLEQIVSLMNTTNIVNDREIKINDFDCKHQSLFAK